MRFQVKILMIPRPVLMPIVFVLCVIGSFAVNVRAFDLWVMFAFGLIGSPAEIGLLPRPRVTAGGDGP